MICRQHPDKKPITNSTQHIQTQRKSNAPFISFYPYADNTKTPKLKINYMQHIQIHGFNSTHEAGFNNKIESKEL
jgi:hypothetical protein